MNIEFHDPYKCSSSGSCNICPAQVAERPVTRLRLSGFEVRLCVRCLQELRQAVLDEYRKRVIIPNAPQRRRDGGLPPIQELEGYYRCSSCHRTRDERGHYEPQGNEHPWCPNQFHVRGQ